MARNLASFFMWKLLGVVKISAWVIGVPFLAPSPLVKISIVLLKANDLQFVFSILFLDIENIMSRFF